MQRRRALVPGVEGAAPAHQLLRQLEEQKNLLETQRMTMLEEAARNRDDAESAAREPVARLEAELQTEKANVVGLGKELDAERARETGSSIDLDTERTRNSGRSSTDLEFDKARKQMMIGFKRMRDDDLIDEDEFYAKRKRLLNL